MENLAESVDKPRTVEVHCSHSEMREVADLVENPRNPNGHPEQQIEMLAKIIANQGWRNPIVVSSRSGFIVKGHGRYQAALKLGLDEVPIDIQDYENEAAEWADMIADNRIAELAEIQRPELKDLLEELDDGSFDMDLTGFDVDALGDLMSALPPEGEDPYTQNVNAPIYEPTGECPELEELADSAKCEDLIDRIQNANVPDDIAAFLVQAAQRHRVFNYSNIAEYYAHAEPEIQELFEDSALVIVDFNKAIEEGYASLREGIYEVNDEDNADLDE